MTDPIITMAPTLTNPDAIDNVAELRRELHQANESILKLSSTAHGLRCTLNAVASDLARIIVAHLNDDPAALQRELQDFAERRVQFVQSATGVKH